MAGTIGATHDNDLGVDGLNSWARLVVRAREPSTYEGDDNFELRESWGSNWIQAYGTLVQERADVRVINMSLGYNWGGSGIDSDTNADAQAVANEQGVFLPFSQALLESQGFDLPVLAVAGGNDLGRDARSSSAMAHAALALGDHNLFAQNEANIIVVEAMTSCGNRATFSNIGGHVSAPGDDILSTVLSNDYAFASGTPMASPQVAGLAS